MTRKSMLRRNPKLLRTVHHMLYWRSQVVRRFPSYGVCIREARRKLILQNIYVPAFRDHEHDYLKQIEFMIVKTGHYPYGT